MSDTITLPHIYYTVTELSYVKDVKSLKNLNVKTLAYIRESQAFELNFVRPDLETSDKGLELDLRHVSYPILEMKPYIIFGILYSLNQSVALCVKSLKQFEGNFEQLEVYHRLLLAVRKKSIHFRELQATDAKANKTNE